MNSLQISCLRRWRFVFLLYIGLLVCSHLYESYQTPFNNEEIRIEVDSTKSGLILFFPDLEQSYFSKNRFSKLVDENFQFYGIDYRSLALNQSQLSAASYADEIINEVSKSKIDSLVIIAEGFGAVIATNFIKNTPLLSKQYILINPEGIQEFELLGGYHLNKAIYSTGIAVSWILENSLPDFGFFSDSKFDLRKLKTRLNTDLRKSKDLYKEISIPTLIINSSNKSVYKTSSSKEFNRMITTSSLQSILSKDGEVNLITSFINHRNNYSSTSVSRKIKSLIPFSTSNVLTAEGWLLTGLMILIILSTFISEDLACIGAGLMVARGLMGFLPAVGACIIGIFVGDILIYLSGRWLGRNATKRAPIKWFISENDIQKSYQWFNAKGPAIIIISRFIPGTRFPTYFSAGVIGASFWMFIFYFGIASLIWTPMLVGASKVLGQKLIYYFSIYQDYALVVLSIAIILCIIILKLIVPLFTYKGRRLLYGKLQRTLRWEFWSIYVLYTPVFIYTLYLWAVYKKITVVTAANPGIDEGGFIGESKKEILDGIGTKVCIAKYHFLDHKNDVKHLADEAMEFMELNDLDFPIVIKPNKGERGRKVQIVKNVLELEDSIKKLTETHLIQEYIKGVEFGVFYYRYPSEKSGNIFSITKKVGVSVIGDGEHTLEQLILMDSRAVCMAETHFDNHIDKLYSIPEVGKEIKLVELGTHSRGALFLDGNDLITDKLTEKIDEVSKSFEGFYFGRYDVKVPSTNDLQEGSNIRIIEVNGVTSESTNIYDPQHSFVFAVKTLMKQWRIAFEIGFYNHNNGVNIPSLKHMLNLVIRN